MKFSSQIAWIIAVLELPSPLVYNVILTVPFYPCKNHSKLTEQLTSRSSTSWNQPMPHSNCSEIMVFALTILNT